MQLLYPLYIHSFLKMSTLDVFLLITFILLVCLFCFWIPAHSYIYYLYITSLRIIQGLLNLVLKRGTALSYYLAHRFSGYL